MAGTLYIISAPSGAGKTSLVRALVNAVPDISVSVSHTTRASRPGEVDGQDYYFVDKAHFSAMINDGAFLEHAQVFDNFYGTSKAHIDERLARGQDVLLEIDWQGAQQVRRQMQDTVSIFILPPSKAALRERLTQRGQDNAEVVERRLAAAVSEMQHYGEFDYLIVNDQFQVALEQLASLFLTRRLRCAAQATRLQSMLSDLLQD